MPEKIAELEAIRARAAAYSALNAAKFAAERDDDEAAQAAVNKGREALEKSRTWAAVARAEEA